MLRKGLQPLSQNVQHKNKSNKAHSAQKDQNQQKSKIVEIKKSEEPEEILQLRLAHKDRQLQSYRAKIDMLQKQNASICRNIQQLTLQKQSDSKKICEMALKIGELEKAKNHFEKQLEVANGERDQYRKKWQGSNAQKQVQSIRNKHQSHQTEQMNLYYKKQCEQLRLKNKKEEDLLNRMKREKQQQEMLIYHQEEQNRLLSDLNLSLRNQVQQLILELKMAKRKSDVQELNSYERKIDLRRSLIKQFNEEEEIKNQEQMMDKQALISLLQTRIHTLEHKLEVSEQRCRKLQSKLIQI